MDNLFFFWGQEDFLINSEIEKIKEKNIDKNFESMAYKRFYEPSFDDLINSIVALPMMFGNVMHVIDVDKFFLSDGESIDDWSLKQFEEALKNQSEKNIVVFRLIIPKDSKKKVDTRKKIYKIVAKYAVEKQFPIFRDFDKTLPNVINQIASQHGIKLSQNVIKVLIEQLGTSLGIINSELQKLAITIYPKKEPDIEDIKNICAQKDDVFIILESIFKKDKDKALSELKKVFEKSSYQEVLGALQYSLRNFLFIKINYPKIGKSGIFQKTRTPEFIIEKNYQMMSALSENTLFQLKKNLMKVDYSIKTGECPIPENAIEMALIGVENV